MASEYSIDEKGNVRTPGGCRVDNGRALSAIEWNVFQEYIRFSLSGGTYYLKGSGIGDVFLLLTNRKDPGCAWNTVLAWNKPVAGLSKEEPPNDPENDIWTVAFPPDYKPQTLV